MGLGIFFFLMNAKKRWLGFFTIKSQYLSTFGLVLLRLTLTLIPKFLFSICLILIRFSANLQAILPLVKFYFC